MLANQLSPEEKERLERLMKEVKNSPLSFITRQKVRIIMTNLGVKKPGRIVLSEALDILQDDWPFKIYRLRKLINGRRRQ